MSTPSTPAKSPVLSEGRTPGPWTTSIYGRINGDHRHLGMHGAVQTAVATCHPGEVMPGISEQFTWENRETWAPQAEANAAHIVRCVNNFDALSSALRDLLAALDEGLAWSGDKRVQHAYAVLRNAGIEP